MPWRSEADAVLALTRAAREALARGELEALGALLQERGERVRRLAELAPARPPEPDLASRLAAIADEARELDQALRAARDRAGAALSGRAPATDRTLSMATAVDRHA